MSSRTPRTSSLTRGIAFSFLRQSTPSDLTSPREKRHAESFHRLPECLSHPGRVQIFLPSDPRHRCDKKLIYRSVTYGASTIMVKAPPDAQPASFCAITSQSASASYNSSYNDYDVSERAIVSDVVQQVDQVSVLQFLAGAEASFPC